MVVKINLTNHSLMWYNYSMKIKQHIPYKNITFCCKDCGTKISYKSALCGKGRCASCAKKGKNNIWFGKKFSKIHCLKLGKSHKGKKRSKEFCKKISDIHLGKKLSKEHKLKISKTRIGNFKGKNNGNWKGGISFFPYTKDFNQELKLKIRTRDNFMCQHCKLIEKEHLKIYKQVLHIHHIDYNKFNCTENNLITLCNACNLQANSDRDYWFAYYTYIIEHFKERVFTFKALVNG
jgi:hypothetical protein